MRVLICYSGVSGYMVACWKALAKHPGITLKIVLICNEIANADSHFQLESLIEGLDCTIVTAADWGDEQAIASLAESFRPDVVLLSGWFYPPYNRLLQNRALNQTKFILMMDNPLGPHWRQRIARLKIGWILDRVDLVWVPGERAWQLARYWKVPESRIRKGLYAVSARSVSPALEDRTAGGREWPKSFVYCGRYQDIKGIDVLVDAYRRYRESVDQPWPMECCGAGPLASALESVEGLSDLGFVQPSEMRGVWARSGVFVLLSRYDPWPLVVAEACSAGLPALCSVACGSGVELVRAYFNGLSVATGDVQAAADALRWFHMNHHLLSTMGERSRSLAAPYAAEEWVNRLVGMVAELN